HRCLMPGRAARCTALFLIWATMRFLLRCVLPLCAAAAAQAEPAFVYSPYQHFALTIDRDTFAVRLPPAGVKTLTWAFAVGERVLKAIRRHALDEYTINLMVMDYGPAQPANCVVKEGACDMAASAVQAALNLHRGHGVPLHRIELTPMIGVNDVVANVFTLADARTLTRWVREQG